MNGKVLYDDGDESSITIRQFNNDPDSFGLTAESGFPSQAEFFLTRDDLQRMRDRIDNFLANHPEPEPQ